MNVGKKKMESLKNFALRLLKEINLRNYDIIYAFYKTYFELDPADNLHRINQRMNSFPELMAIYLSVVLAAFKSVLDRLSEGRESYYKFIKRIDNIKATNRFYSKTRLSDFAQIYIDALLLYLLYHNEGVKEKDLFALSFSRRLWWSHRPSSIPFPSVDAWAANHLLSFETENKLLDFRVHGYNGTKQDLSLLEGRMHLAFRSSVDKYMHCLTEKSLYIDFKRSYYYTDVEEEILNNIFALNVVSRINPVSEGGNQQGYVGILWTLEPYPFGRTLNDKYYSSVDIFASDYNLILNSLLEDIMRDFYIDIFYDTVHFFNDLEEKLINPFNAVRGVMNKFMRSLLPKIRNRQYDANRLLKLKDMRRLFMIILPPVVMELLFYSNDYTRLDSTRYSVAGSDQEFSIFEIIQGMNDDKFLSVPHSIIKDGYEGCIPSISELFHFVNNDLRNIIDRIQKHTSEVADSSIYTYLGILKELLDWEQ